jgi:hypothetical protein
MNTDYNLKPKDKTIQPLINKNHAVSYWFNKNKD